MSDAEIIDVVAPRGIAKSKAKTPPLPVAAVAPAAAEPKSTPVFDPLRAGETWTTFLSTLWQNPSEVAAAQATFWQKYARLCDSTWRTMGKDAPAAPVITPAPQDRRFKDKGWNEPYFSFLKQSYLLAAETLSTLSQTAGKKLPQNDQLRLNMLIRQILAAWSPSNFAAANPEAVRATLEHSGRNLLRGFEQWQRDVEKGGLRRSPAQAFVVGETLAATPGKVVFRNNLIELLQYTPTTEQVHKRPLLIMPPWINRGYIVDLQPQNSFVKHAVDAGFTVFLISWVNPTTAHADYTFDSYAREGLYAALDTMRSITGEHQADVVGYCVGGTLLSAAAAREGVEKQKHIHSITLLTTQTDFSQAGDLLAFTSEAQIDDIKKQMHANGGWLAGREMSTVFDMLRPEDMIWMPAVRSYLLGLEPQSFDLLFWNDDNVRMPAAMHAQYLEQFYLHNRFAQGGLSLLGTPIAISDIKTPAYVVACREDHIAPAASVYNGLQHFTGKVRLVSADSGHIAGIINPPAAGKYAFRAADVKNGAQLPQTIALFDAQTAECAGSWWNDWAQHLAAEQTQVPARDVNDYGLGDAPGSYMRAV